MNTNQVTRGKMNLVMTIVRRGYECGDNGEVTKIPYVHWADKTTFSLTQEDVTDGWVETHYDRDLAKEAMGFPLFWTQKYRVFACPEFAEHPPQKEWELDAGPHAGGLYAQSLWLILNKDAPMFCIDVASGNCQMIPKNAWSISKKTLDILVDSWHTQCMQPMQREPIKDERWNAFVDSHREKAKAVVAPKGFYAHSKRW